MMVAGPDILNANILIVDDQEANVRLLEQMLRDAGYRRIASTMNPLEVCALHRQNGYDLILDASAAVYFSDTPDVTEDVIKLADGQYKKK